MGGPAIQSWKFVGWWYEGNGEFLLRRDNAWLTWLHVFPLIAVCNFVQFVVNEVDKMDDGSTSCSDWKQMSKVKKETMFHVKSVLQHYKWGDATYNQYPGARKAKHTNLMEQIVHLWRIWANWDAVLAQLNCKCHGDVPTTNLWWTDLTSQIMHVSAEEHIVVSVSEISSYKWEMRPEQKSVASIMDIVSRLSKSGHVNVAHCSGTLATTKACMLLPQHRQFIECAIDTGSYNHFHISGEETLWVGSKWKLGHHWIKRGCRADKWFVRAMDGIATNTKKMIWRGPPWLSLTQ